MTSNSVVSSQQPARQLAAATEASNTRQLISLVGGLFSHLMCTVPALQPSGCGAKPRRGNMGNGVPSFQAAT